MRSIEKITKYQDLAVDLQSLRKVQVKYISVVISALGIFLKKFEETDRVNGHKT